MKPTTGSRISGGPALVLAAGTVPLPRLIPALLEGVTLVIAADGGLAHARTLRLEPDLLIGDMDSVTGSDLATFPDVPRQTHRTDKDEMDLELAISVALSRGASQVRVVGAFGSRFDQSVAALLIAARYARGQGGGAGGGMYAGADADADAGAGAGGAPEISLHSANHEAHIVTPSRPKSLELPAGTTVSLLALDPDGVVSSSGLAYEVAERALPYGTGLGVSNSVAGAPGGLASVVVEVHAGTVALLVEHDAGAANPRAAIWGSQAQRIEESLAAADPDMADLVTSVVYDRVFARPGLDLRTRELISVAVLTALGAEDELTTHIRGAMLVGASEEELREALIHTAMFVGFPRAIQAMRRLQEYLERRPG